MKEISIKEAQKAMLEILKKIDEICDEQNITYFLMYGTLIGAVRHKGIIPWDDDIDIMMPRDDYDKFINYFLKYQDELKPYELYSQKNRKNYPYIIARISDSRYILDSKNEKDYGIGLFVDIYPFDGMGNNKEEAIRLGKKADHLSSLCFLTSRLHFGVDNTKSKLKMALKIPAYIYAKIKKKIFYG